MSEERNVILKLENVKEYYRLKSKKLFDKPSYLKAVDGIDLEIYKGETFGIVGESGCGKSTIGRIMVNLLAPTDGKVEFQLDQFASDSSSKQTSTKRSIEQDIQIIFQDPYSSLNPKKKIGWLMREPLEIHRIGKNRAERDAMVRNIIKIVGYT